MRLPESLGLIFELAVGLGYRNLSQRPDCLELDVDDKWWVAINGRNEPTECSEGVKLEPISVYLKCNGWPAGIIDLGGGVILADGEKALIDALKTRIARLNGTAPTGETHGAT